MPKIVRVVEQSALVAAIAHAQTLGEEFTAAADFMLANISTRLADGLREEVSQLGKVKTKTGEEAMTAITSAIRTLQETGELVMRNPGNEEAES